MQTQALWPAFMEKERVKEREQDNTLPDAKLSSLT
jgi:hypothetical protein